MSNSVFSKGDFKFFSLSELKGKSVDIVSVGQTEEGCLIYMRDSKSEDIYVIASDEDKNRHYKDCILKDFKSVDFSEIKAAMIVIYDHPEDYSNAYVARIWDMNKPTNVAVINERLDILRNTIPENMSSIGRHKNDDPCILEIWI